MAPKKPSTVLPLTPRLVQVAELAGFLKLQGSDLVFSSNERGLIYYDCIMSCRWSDYGLVCYLAVLDQKTNITEIQQYKIGNDKLNSMKKFPTSDLTAAALSFHIWHSILKNKKVLILINDWLHKEEHRDELINEKEKFNYGFRWNAIDLVRIVARKYDISFHIEMIENDSNQALPLSVTTMSRRSPIMFRLMMCKNQPIVIDVQDYWITDFHSILSKAAPTNCIKSCQVLSSFLSSLKIPYFMFKSSLG